MIFKIWDKKEERWVDNDSVFVNSLGWKISPQKRRLRMGYYCSEESPLFGTKKDIYNIYYPTGIFDKNNVEIFEGDIVECVLKNGDNKLTLVVTYIAERGAYLLIDTTAKEYYEFAQIHHICSSLQVVSNVCENPIFKNDEKEEKEWQN